jgi:hypothetical protein
MSKPSRVLLTPLAISDDQGHFVCIAIRDPETEEIVNTVVTSHDLAEKAGIPLDEAQRIFRAARDVADLRLVE